MTTKKRRERLRLMDQLIKFLALIALENFASRDELLQLVETAYNEENGRQS